MWTPSRNPVTWNKGKRLGVILSKVMTIEFSGYFHGWWLETSLSVPIPVLKTGKWRHRPSFERNLCKCRSESLWFLFVVLWWFLSPNMSSGNRLHLCYCTLNEVSFLTRLTLFLSHVIRLSTLLFRLTRVWVSLNPLTVTLTKWFWLEKVCMVVQTVILTWESLYVPVHIYRHKFVVTSV